MIETFTIIRIFKCDSCENGVVKLTQKKTKGNYSVKVGGCNKCKKSFGLKSIISLSELK
jgi:hypothetical protein